MDKQQKAWGEWAFVLGILFATFLAFFPQLIRPETSSVVLVVLGTFVGLLNITPRERTEFLAAAIVLLMIGSGGLQQIPTVGEALRDFAVNLFAFVAPAAFVVAVKTVIDIGRKA